MSFNTALTTNLYNPSARRTSPQTKLKGISAMLLDSKDPNSSAQVLHLFPYYVKRDCSRMDTTPQPHTARDMNQWSLSCKYTIHCTTLLLFLPCAAIIILFDFCYTTQCFGLLYPAPWLCTSCQWKCDQRKDENSGNFHIHTDKPNISNIIVILNANMWLSINHAPYSLLANNAELFSIYASFRTTSYWWQYIRVSIQESVF